MGAQSNSIYDCPHNAGLRCEPCGRDCKTCGWTPEGDARRRTALRGGKTPPPKSQPASEVKRRGYNYTAPKLTKVCKICGTEFETHSHRALYCPICKSTIMEERERERQRAYYHRKKEEASHDKGKTPKV